MKYFLLSVSKNEKLKSVNIGDYVQALASAQYYPRVDGFLDRDEDLKDYDGEEAKNYLKQLQCNKQKKATQ